MSNLGINFSNRAITQDGNEYNSTNVGKTTGAVVGTGIAAYTGYAMNKAKKMILSEDVVEIMKNGANQVVESFPDDIKSISQGVAETLPKYLKKSMNIGAIIVGGLSLLSAIGVGTLVDGTINKVRALKADKSNPMIKSEEV